MIKTQNKLHIEGNFFSLIKRLRKTYISHPIFRASTNIALKVLIRAVRQENKTKEIKIGKEGVMLSLLICETYLDMKDPEKYTKNPHYNK